MKGGDLSHWPPELRRALISVQPAYFGWSPDEQLRYRAKLPDADREAVVTALLRAQGRRRPEAAAKLESRGRVSLRLQHEINQWLQPLVGIGEDGFNLNESFAEGRSILDFPTLLAYDQDDHAYQEDARERDDPKHVRRPYAGALHATWARCLVDGRLCYLTLSMAAWYLYGAMQTAASDEIERLVPHRYARGPDDGKEEGGLIRWDHRVDAGGHEALLEELQHRVWDYEARRCQDLLVEFKDHGRAATWFIDDPYPDAAKAEAESNLLIVFSDPEVLSRVRFTSFLGDCRAMEKPRHELNTLEDREVQAILNFAREQHDDLRRNFDPKEATLRKRLKVMLHPEVLRDLEDGETS
jgi:hypothetical protein